ncbi:MAG: hypothetical protein K0R34_2805 [Herbinix sp.]|jgi:hypothetical protein|nr:hypothetical protein [Herbinix sp.]
MKYTPNYGFKMPEPLIDNVNPDVFNDNSEIIDTGLSVYVGVTAGSGNAYAITSDKIASLNAGLGVCVKFHAASTGASTLNINELGAKAIKKPSGNDALNLSAGLYTLRYDGTNFILQGEGASGDATASDLLLGKKATTDAGEITGTMPDNGPGSAVTVELNNQNQEYTILAGKHSGLRKIKAVITNLAASVIKAGVTVGGILGTFTNDATAIDSDVLSGKTYYRIGNKGTGSIPSKSAQTYSPSTSAQVIGFGQYLSGNQTIAATTGTAAAGDCLAGKTFNSANGIGLTGSMANQGAKVITPSTVNQAIPAGYHNGGGYVAGDANLTPAMLPEYLSLFGVQGTRSSKRFASGTITSTMSGEVFVGPNNSHALFKVVVSGLSFKPSIITIVHSDVYNEKTQERLTIYRAAGQIIANEVTVLFIVSDGSTPNMFTINGAIAPAYVVSGGFCLPTYAQGQPVNWAAWE